MEVEVVGEAVMVGEVVVTDSVGVTHLAVEDTLSSVGVTHLADSPAVALVRDSAEGGDFLLVTFLVAEMMAVFGIATLDAMGIPEITRSAIIAISSAISIS